MAVKNVLTNGVQDTGFSTRDIINAMFTKLSESEDIKFALISFFIIILPFLLFYWIAPFVSDLMMGNDFRYSVHQQMEMMFAIKTKTFPLYHPSYALGTSSITLTFSQIFHPIAYLCYVMPGYWNGKALQWYEFFKLLSLGVAQLVLFIFIRRLRIDSFFSFLISFVVIYNLRMLDLFRFGASLESYTTYLVLCAFTGMYFISPSRWHPLCIIVGTYLLVVSGHPQMMFYGLLGYGIFLLFAPFFLSDILVKRIKFYEVVRFWIKVGLFIIIGIILSSNYILPFYFDFYVMNVGRVGQSLDWSTADIGVAELLNNFFLPLHADIHGAFGGSYIIIMVLLLPVIRCFNVHIPRSVWVIWGVIVTIFLYMLGEKTPVYKLAWQYIPFVSSFRHQGRVSMILPSLFLLILIWITNVRQYKHPLRLKRYVVYPYSIFVFFSLLAIPLYILVYLILKPPIGDFPAVGINEISKTKLILMIFAGSLSLIGVAIYDKGRDALRIYGVVLSLMALLQVGIVLRHGTFTDPIERQPTFEDLKELKRKGVWWWSGEFINMHSSVVITQLENSFMEPFLGKIFTEVIPVKSQDEAYRMMKDMRLPHQVFIEDYDIERAKRITGDAGGMIEGEAKLVYSSYNRLVFEVNSESPAIFGFSYPYIGHWRAWVNGVNVKVYRANGAAHAIEIPKGKSIVEFRYRCDAFFWGMIITSGTFILIGILFSLSNLTGIKRIVVVIGVIMLGVGMFMFWYNSLYNGEDIGVEYRWMYIKPMENSNIAYGKGTSGVYLPSTAYLRRHSSRAVDGDKSLASGFTLDPSINDFLIIDLNTMQKIKEIIIYGSFLDATEMYISGDGREWRDVTHSGKTDNKEPDRYKIEFGNPEIARYVKVQPSLSKIGIDEVEVYRE